MLPTQDTSHVDEALALLIDQYKGTKVVAGLTAVYARQIQQLENALWTLLNQMTLATLPVTGGPWDIYDKIGAIVGIARHGLTDAQYLPQLKIKIRASRSDGLANDIIAIASMVTSNFAYVEWPDVPAAFEVQTGVFDLVAITALLTYLGAAKGAGVAGNLTYIAASAPILIWDDVVTPGIGTGFDDSTTPGTFPNLLESGQTLGSIL
jgi:hypothetical protein